MIDDLLVWPVRSAEIQNLVRRTVEINHLFGEVEDSVVDILDTTIPNRGLAIKTLRKITPLLAQARKPRRLSTEFDALVRDDIVHSLEAQREYLRFLFTEDGTAPGSTRRLFDTLFKGGRGQAGAFDWLERRLSRLPYDAITERQQLLSSMSSYAHEAELIDLSHLMSSQLPRVRKMLSRYNEDMQIQTRAESKRLDDIAKQQEKASRQLRNRGNVDAYLRSIQWGNVRGRLGDLVYRLTVGSDEVSTFQWGTKHMTLREGLFFFYQDKKTGKPDIYTADMDTTAGHENYHRLQEIFSRQMPESLRAEPDQVSLTANVVVEGMATGLEPRFHRWLVKHAEAFNLTEQELRAASLVNAERHSTYLVRLCMTVYQREVNVEGASYDPHKRLAQKTRNPLYRDPNFFPDPHIAQEIYSVNYLFGQDHFNRTFEELKRREAAALGSPQAATHFINEHWPVIMQGMLTGCWGWKTHGRFFLDHYWPLARKHCEPKQTTYSIPKAAVN